MNKKRFDVAFTLKDTQKLTFKQLAEQQLQES